MQEKQRKVDEVKAAGEEARAQQEAAVAAAAEAAALAESAAQAGEAAALANEAGQGEVGTKQNCIIEILEGWAKCWWAREKE